MPARVLNCGLNGRHLARIHTRTVCSTASFLFDFYSNALRMSLHMTHIFPSLFVGPICPLFKLKRDVHRESERARAQLKPFVRCFINCVSIFIIF